MNPIQEYFYSIDEPARSTLLFLRKKILESDCENITETLSFGLPFLNTKRKCFATCITAKSIRNITSVSIVVTAWNIRNSFREAGKSLKILLIDINEDMPVEFILKILIDVKKYL